MLYASFFGWIGRIVGEYSLQILKGIGITLLLSLVGTVVGFIIACIFSYIKTKKDAGIVCRILRVFVNAYVTVIRGTPMMVQALIFYYSFKLMGINWDPLTSGLFTVSINTTAYLTEVLRGGIESVDSGQYEAARSVGMGSFQTMLFVIYPQAIKNSMAAIGNEFIVNIKDTSVLNVIGVIEVYNACLMAGNKYFKVVEAMSIAAIIYLVLTLTSSYILKAIERRVGSPVKEITSSN